MVTAASVIQLFCNENFETMYMLYFWELCNMIVPQLTANINNSKMPHGRLKYVSIQLKLGKPSSRKSGCAAYTPLDVKLPFNSISTY